MVFSIQHTAEDRYTAELFSEDPSKKDKKKSEILHKDTDKPNTSTVLKFKEGMRGRICGFF